MKDALKQLLSTIPQQAQEEWKQLSEFAIESGKVERLTENGLFQAINLMGWHFATDAMLYNSGQYSDEDWSYITTVKAPTMDKINETIALSSGIHPMAIIELSQARANHYNMIYMQ